MNQRGYLIGGGIFIAALVALGILQPSAGAATRTDTFTSGNITIASTCFLPMDDGGAAIQACGTVTSDDGGMSYQSCQSFIPRTAGQQNKTTTAFAAGAQLLIQAERMGDAGL
jgi:hypothetical protein